MSELIQRNESFRQLLETLNPAQRAAVEKLEGPVLVVAGPGTGKTHLLSARIGNILLHTDARAQNVLCLTFTDAAAHAMRQRLLAQIGPEAHRVPIFTFHGFCNRVIQDNQEYFGQGRLEPLSDLERIEVVRALLSELPVEHPLRAGKKDLFQYEAQLRDLFLLMKKEGWTPGHVLRNTDTFLRELPQHPRYIYQKTTKYGKKGEPKTAQIAAITEKMTRLKAAADLFPKYQRALERLGRYEYEDMLLWVNKAFEKHEALLRNYQERYQYLLVDEFQDTNGAQFQLINHLLDYWETPNILIVGDDDQSIFEFQGARLENLLQFARHYRQGLEVLVLQENYRSTQGILDAAGRLVGHNQLRAVERLEPPIQKVLRAHTTRTSLPRRSRYPTRLHELTAMVQQIEALIQNGTPPESIAVLYSRHKQAVQLQNLLGKKGIPFQTKRPTNVLEVPVIQHFRSLLEYLRDELDAPFSGETRLFKLLHAAFWGLNPLDLALIAASCRPAGAVNEAPTYGSSEEFTQPQWSFFWRNILCDPARLASLALSDPERLLQTGQLLNQWIGDAANLPLPQLLEQLATQSGLLAWCLTHPDKVWLLQALQSFLDAMPLPTARKQPNVLAHFLQLLDSMEDNGLPLPLRSNVETAPGVQLLTAHAAKGLEFEHVFIFDATEDAWESNTGDTRGRFTLPETLTLSGEEDALEARRRLFYVAMTRAKTGLYLSYAATGADGKALTQSRFVDEAGLPEENPDVAEAAILETQTLLITAPPQPVIQLPEQSVIDQLLRDFTLSITALNRYLRCPIAFWYEDLLKVPSAMSEAAAFGIAMHGALQRFFLKMKSDKQGQWPSSEQLGKLFEKEMGFLRGHFAAAHFEQRLVLGKENLRRIYAEQVPFWRKRAIVERRISQAVWNGIPLTGVLDKIEWLDSDRLRIVDYKTGTPSAQKTAAPSPQQPYGGEYWRQLAFYQILIDNARLYPEKVQKTAIHWLEPDQRGAFPVTEISFDAGEINLMEQLITTVYQQIKARRFDTGCGKPDCTWCTLHRERALHSELERRAEDNLDDA